MSNAARSALPPQPIRPVQGTRPKHLDELDSPRRGNVPRKPQDSSISPREDRADAPGEDVLGGADGIPLGNDTPPKRPDPFEP